MNVRFLSTVLAAMLAIGAIAQTTQTKRPTAAGPLPLDPLTPEEVASAGQIAVKNERVVAIAGSSARVVVVQFIAPKRSQQSEPSGRNAEVIVHNDRENNGGARVLVDLSGGVVTDVVRLTERNVPIGPSDIEAAASLALQHQGVQRLLGGPEAARTFRVSRGPVVRSAIQENLVQGVSNRGVDPDDPCTIHRCVTLFFRSGGRYIAINQVNVDLSARRVDVREEVRP